MRSGFSLLWHGVCCIVLEMQIKKQCMSDDHGLFEGQNPSECLP